MDSAQVWDLGIVAGRYRARGMGGCSSAGGEGKAGHWEVQEIRTDTVLGTRLTMVGGDWKSTSPYRSGVVDSWPASACIDMGKEKISFCQVAAFDMEIVR